MIGYHYTYADLKEGDIITSQQHKAQTFSVVSFAFKLTNTSLPDKWGYAYPEQKETFKNYNCFLVESNEVIQGNFDFSVYKTMDALSNQNFQLDKNIPLKKRLEMRGEWLKEQAEKYFNELNDKSKIELISSSFKVIKKVH